jgi:hypothetical protein
MSGRKEGAKMATARKKVPTVMHPAQVWRLRQLIEALRSRTWLSPVSADEMNRIQRYYADALQQCVPKKAKTTKTIATGMTEEELNRLNKIRQHLRLAIKNSSFGWESKIPRIQMGFALLEIDRMLLDHVKQLAIRERKTRAT